MNKVVIMTTLKEFLDEKESQTENPDILLIDLPDEIYRELKSKGFNVSKGSFGTPYSVYKSNKYFVVKGKGHLPVISEQNIVMINLYLDLVNESDVVFEDHGEVSELFCRHTAGWVDPRPQAMDENRDRFDRIFEKGAGIFVIFAEPMYDYDFLMGRMNHSRLSDAYNVEYNNWSFLSIFDIKKYRYLEIEGDEGKKLSLSDDKELFKDKKFLKDFLVKYINQMKCNSRFTPVNLDFFSCLLKNKFGDCVGCLINSDDPDKIGYILILPYMPITPQFILDLLNDVLRELSPHLFSNVEGQWIERKEYQIATIRNYENRIQRLIKNVTNEIDYYEGLIAYEKEQYGFLQGILINTGAKLVVDVKKCLEFIKFEKVVNVDEIKKTKEEDLWICDEPPLVIEVKGPLSANTKDSDVKQASTYVGRRRVQWDRSDVNGVLIMNHQSRIPPLERDHINVFTENQIKDAIREDVCLITTWELFLLMRGMMEYKWNPKVIRDLFYQPGRIPEVPGNYEPIGNIFSIIEAKNVIGVKITDGELSKGQRVGYKLPYEFLEEDVESLEIEHKAVKNCKIGDKVGVTSKFTDKLKEGLTVYKII